MQEIQTALRRVIQTVFSQDVEPELTRPDEQFGDWAANAALQLASTVGKPPREVAEQLVKALKTELPEVANITIAGPGFINFRLADATLVKQAEAAPHTKPQTYKDKVVVAEYSDPNPFKVLHAGHLYTTVVGEAIARLLEAAGGEVHRVNFGGDVGLHVARAMWGVVHSSELGGEESYKKLKEIAADTLPDWIAKRYVEGNSAYENDPQAKEGIIEYNKRVYEVHDQNDRTSDFARIYWACRKASYDAFKAFYQRMHMGFEKYYPESITTQIGLDTVREQLERGVYQESDGAIVFKGEPHGLHTRVFINSAGLPTYEAKDVGLIMAKWHDYHFDKSVVITGNDIVDYMKVVLKSIEQYEPDLVARSVHLTHGMIRMAGGAKISSRTGKGLSADDIIQAATAASQKATGKQDDDVVLGAVKYAFLKPRIGADIIYEPNESVSLEGNSGPYLQYAHARARSILAKAGDVPGEPAAELAPLERTLARKLTEYPDAVAKATSELMPHHIATYLYELAQTFNRFYEQSRVIGDPRQATRQRLVGLYADVLKDGLGLLNITAPDHL